MKNLNKYLQKIADENPTVLTLPVACFCHNGESRYITGIDHCFENKEIYTKTKLKDLELDFDSDEELDFFYEDVVWNMTLDDYERELKYITNIDEDDEKKYLVLLQREKNTFTIKVELI